MNDNVKSDKDIIIKAIYVLQNNVNKTTLSNNEKVALLKLLEKTLYYYETKKELILRKSDNSNEKIAALQSFITDIIVKINNSLTGGTDIHYLVSLIGKEINEKDLKKIFSRNR